MMGIQPGAAGFGSKYANHCAMLPRFDTYKLCLTEKLLKSNKLNYLLSLSVLNRKGRSFNLAAQTLKFPLKL